MIQCKYPETGELQDPILGKKCPFSIYRASSLCRYYTIELPLDWIALAHMTVNPGKAYYMESQFRGRISEKVKQEICSFLHSEKKDQLLMIHHLLNALTGNRLEEFPLVNK